MIRCPSHVSRGRRTEHMAGTIWRVVILAAGILAGFAVGFSARVVSVGTDYPLCCVIALAVCFPMLALFARELIAMWNGVAARRRPPREFTPVVDPELSDVSLWDVRRSLETAVE